MHELSIALSLIDEIEDQALARGLRGVKAVHLRVGVFSGVDRNALLFAWEMACDGTSLSEARLEIEIIPLVIHCSTCQQDRGTPSMQELICDKCGGPAQAIITGRELELVALEVAA